MTRGGDDDSTPLRTSARLTVAETDEHLLCARRFWPFPAYARRWRFPEDRDRARQSNGASLKRVQAAPDSARPGADAAGSTENIIEEL